MRWDALFADLEAQASTLAAAELDAEVAERIRLEAGHLQLTDRLRAGLGQPVRLRCRGGLTGSGLLTHVGSEWLLLDEGLGRELVVLTAAVVAVSGLGRLTSPTEGPASVSSRLGVRHALRGIARDRSPLQVHLTDTTVVEGTIDRVGGDHVELAVHDAGELRRRAEVRDVLLIPVNALVALRRDN